MHWKKVTLIGVGLLGGSLGLALRRRKLAGQVAGFVRRRATAAEAVALGAIDYGTTSMARALKGADLVVLCTPVGQMRDLMKRGLPHLSQGAIVTDVGSVKGGLAEDLDALARKAGVRFVGSHPMAGSEKNGVSASREDLYDGSVCVVTPAAATDPEALKSIETLWLNVGARVLLLAPDEHDRLVSRSSHLPHLVSACLARLILDPSSPPAQTALCANGFRDTTRIASGSPQMWSDIAAANAKHIASALRQIENDIRTLRKLIEAADRQGVYDFLSQAKSLRDQWRNPASSKSTE